MGGVTQQEADEIAERRQEVFEQELSVARRDDFDPQSGHIGVDVETIRRPRRVFRKGC